MSFVTNVTDLATRISTECKSLRTLINGNASDLAGLTTTDKTTLVAAINEIEAELDALAGGGSPDALDDLSDVVITTPATGDVTRYNGTSWVNVPGTNFFQPLDSDLTSIAALATTSYGRAFLTLADAAALMSLLTASSTTVQGIVELATSTETTTGTDTVRATTPAGVKAAIDAATAALVNSAPGALDTLKELADALGSDPNFATTMATALGNRVRVDTAAQGLNGTQQSNARTNIDVYSKTEIGDPTTNFVTTFEAGLT